MTAATPDSTGDALAPPRRTSPPSPTDAAHPRTILIVEDHVGVREMLRDDLSESGFTTLTAPDGLAGLQMVAAEHPDLVLLDVMMPGMDGWAFLKQLSVGWFTPVILLTARDGAQDRARGVALGANDHLSKPYRLADVLAHVRAHLPGEAA